MLKAFFKISLRNFYKNKTYLLVNIAGLSVGIATFILISLFVRYEFSWDKFNEKHERIFRIEPKIYLNNETEYWNQVPCPIGKLLKDEYPEIINSVCLRETWGEYLSVSDDKVIHEAHGFYAENSLFDIFTFKFILGEPENALTEPNTIVITKKIADKYYPEENPVGKTILANKKHKYKITGVIEDPPENFHLEAEYFISFSSFLLNNNWDVLNLWGSFGSRVFLLLDEHIDVAKLTEKIKFKLNEHNDEFNTELTLKALADCHLLPAGEKGLLAVVYIFGTSAILILLLAGMNFTNLTNAYASTRYKEIGIKKVVGSSRFRLIQQFIGESLIITMIALILAFTLAELSLPLYNRIMDRDLAIEYIGNWQFTLLLIGISVLLGILSASIPAFKLSFYKPVDAIKGEKQSQRRIKKQILSKSLVTFQLFISILFVLFTISNYMQFEYFQNKEMGFDKTHLLLCPVNSSENVKINDWQALRKELLKNPNVRNASISYLAPFNGNEGEVINWEGSQADQKLNFGINYVGYDFLNTYEIKLVEGRNFSMDHASDSTACIINETAWKSIGWENAIGKKLRDNKYHVIGVVKDFHQNSPYIKIAPYIMMLRSQNLKNYKLLSMRIAPENIAETRDYINHTLEDFFPDVIIDPYFMEDRMSQGVLEVYLSMGQTFTFFSVIAIIIAIVGLFALVTFSAKRRVKEIGIRKVMGASTWSIYKLISRQYLILFSIAIIIATLLDFFTQDFNPAAYKPEMDPLNYVYVISGVLLVVLLTISFQVIKTSRANPVDSLRYE